MEMIFHSHVNKTHFHKEGNVHLASVWKWGFLELGSGILVGLKRFAKDEIWIYFSEKSFPLEKDRDTIWNWTAILFFTETVAFIDVTKALTNGFLDDWYSTFNPKFCFLSEESSLWGHRSPKLWTSQCCFSIVKLGFRVRTFVYR